MTTFQSGATEEIRLALNTQFATTSAGDLQLIPHSGNPSGPSKPYSRGPTDEVQANLQINDNLVRGFTVPFSYGGIWRYGIHDMPIQMILGSPWSAAVAITDTDIASNDTGNTFSSATTGKFDALAADVPCPVWIFRDGASPLATMAIATAVVEGATPSVTIGLGDGSDTFGVDLADVAAGDSVTIMHGGINRIGTTEYFAIAERAQTGLGIFYVGLGLMCTSWSLQQAKGSDATVSFDFMGIDADDALTTFGTGTVTAANTFPAFSTGADWRFFGEGGKFSSYDPTDDVTGWLPQSMNLNVASAANAIDAMGQDGPSAHTKDTVIVSGDYSIFTNKAGRLLGQKQKLNQDSSLFWANKKTDTSGVTAAYAHWVPRVQYESTDQDGGGQGGTLTSPTPWMASQHPTYLDTYVIGRFPALVTA